MINAGDYRSAWANRPSVLSGSAFPGSAANRHVTPSFSSARHSPHRASTTTDREHYPAISQLMQSRHRGRGNGWVTKLLLANAATVNDTYISFPRCRCISDADDVVAELLCQPHLVAEA